MNASRSFPHVAHGDAVDELALVLRLLDHQVVGADGELVGNVEDLVLERRRDALAAVGLVLGTEGWARRQPGLVGHWVEAVWRRLHRQEHPRPTTLAFGHVLHLDSAVHVDEAATRWALATSDFERWLRQHLVAPIPGSGTDGDDDPDSAPRTPGRVRNVPPDEPGRLRLSELLGADVVDESGRGLGRVIEVHARPGDPGPDTAELLLTSMTHGHHAVGSGLGYGDDSHTGPAVLARLVRWWHRHDRVTRWEDVLEVAVATESSAATVRVRVR